MTQYTKTVRMPPDVYEKAKAAADRRRMALNAYVTDVVERDLGGVRLVSAPSNVPPHVRDVVRPAAAGFSDSVSCAFSTVATRFTPLPWVGWGSVSGSVPGTTARRLVRAP